MYHYSITRKGRVYLALYRIGAIKSKADEAWFERHWNSIQQKKEAAHHEEARCSDSGTAAAE